MQAAIAGKPSAAYEVLVDGTVRLRGYDTPQRGLRFYVSTLLADGDRIDFYHKHLLEAAAVAAEIKPRPDVLDVRFGEVRFCGRRW